MPNLTGISLLHMQFQSIKTITLAGPDVAMYIGTMQIQLGLLPNHGATLSNPLTSKQQSAGSE